MTSSTLFVSSVTPVTGTLTVTVHDAVKPPSAVFTVIVAVPAPTALTWPDWLTVATASLLLVQVTALFVALDGATVAVSCLVFPMTSSMLFVSSVTPVTGTLTVNVAALLVVLPA